MVRENSCPWDENTCDLAAEGGHLRVLKWARQNGCPWTDMTSISSAGNGHFEVLKWAVENGCPSKSGKLKPPNEHYLFEVASRGNLEVLQWAMNQPNEIQPEQIFIILIEFGHLDCLKWMYDTTVIELFDLKVDLFTGVAVSKNQLVVLKWLREKGYPWSKDEFWVEMAWKEGYFETIQWATNNGLPWKELKSVESQQILSLFTIHESENPTLSSHNLRS